MRLPRSSVRLISTILNRFSNPQISFDLYVLFTDGGSWCWQSNKENEIEIQLLEPEKRTVVCAIPNPRNAPPAVSRARCCYILSKHPHPWAKSVFPTETFSLSLRRVNCTPRRQPPTEYATYPNYTLHCVHEGRRAAENKALERPCTRLQPLRGMVGLGASEIPWLFA